MFVKNISVSQKTDKLPVEDFNFNSFILKNYRGDVVFETSELSSDNTEVTLDGQVYAGMAEIKGNIVVPDSADGGVLETTVGQQRGATWALTTIAEFGQTDFTCVHGLPPTTAAIFSRFMPVPVKSVCEAGTDLPDVEQ